MAIETRSVFTDIDNMLMDPLTKIMDNAITHLLLRFSCST